MKSFQEFYEDANFAYDKANSQYSSLKSGFYKVDGWEVQNRIHSQSRQVDRTGDMDQSGLDYFLTRLIKKVDTWSNKVNKEFLVRSRSKNQSIIVNVDNVMNGDARNPHQVKQIRVMTILPPGKHIATPGTPTIQIESVTYEVIDID